MATRFFGSWLFGTVMLFGSSSVLAQPVTTTYEYDELGNRTRVENLITLVDVAVTAVEPRSAIPGQRINLYGRNFPWPQREETVVLFGDLPATPLRMSDRVITVEVPAGVGGPVAMKLVVPDEPAIEIGTYDIIGITITPQVADVGFSTPVAFTPELFGVDGDLQWSVDGVPGGNAAVGRVDADGLYTSPAPSPDVPLPFLYQVFAEIPGEPYRGAALVRTIWDRSAPLAVDFWASDSLQTATEVLAHTFELGRGDTVPGLFMNADPGLRLSLTGPNGRLVEATTTADAVRWIDLSLLDPGEYRLWVASAAGEVGEYDVAWLTPPPEGEAHWVGRSGDWREGTNWYFGTPPADGQSVVIDVPGEQVVRHDQQPQSPSRILNATIHEHFELSRGELDVSGVAEFRGDLTLSGDLLARLGGPGDVVALGPLFWDGTRMSGAGITVCQGSLEITGGGPSLEARRFENRYNGIWDDVTMRIASGGSFVNGPDATLDVTGRSGISSRVGAPVGGRFLNQGTLRIIDNGRFQIDGNVSMLFENEGLVEIDEGEIEIRNAWRNAGTVEISIDGSLALLGSSASDDFTHESPSLIQGDGLLTLGNTHDFPPEAALAVPIEIYGSVTLRGNRELERVALLNGRLNVTDRLILQHFDWVARSGGGGTITVMETAIIGREDRGTVDLWHGVVELAGHSEWRGGTMTMLNDGTLHVLEAGELLISEDTALRPDRSALGGGVFVNDGLIRRAGASSTEIGMVTFINNGTVLIEEGTFECGGEQFENRGTITVQGPGRLELRGDVPHKFGSVIEGEGFVEFGYGTHTFPVGAQLTAPIAPLQGELRFEDDVTIDHPLTVAASGTLGGGGVITVTGLLTWEDGEMVNRGTTIAAGGLALSGSKYRELIGRRLENHGIGTLSDTRLRLFSGGELVNAAGAELDLAGSVEVTGGSLLNPSGGRFLNEGTLRKTGGDRLKVGAGHQSADMLFENERLVEIMSGEIEISDGGRNAGTITIGLDGLLDLGSDFTHEAGSLIEGEGLVELDGTHTFSVGSANAFSVIDVSGTIDLSARLEVVIDPDYLPMLGDEFPIVRGGVVIGGFDNAVSIPLEGGLWLRSRVEADGGVTLVVEES